VQKNSRHKYQQNGFRKLSVNTAFGQKHQVLFMCELRQNIPERLDNSNLGVSCCLKEIAILC